MGKYLCKALPASQAVTGCDVTGRFAGRGKLHASKMLEEANESIIETFGKLGATDFLLLFSTGTIQHTEKIFLEFKNTIIFFRHNRFTKFMI